MSGSLYDANYASLRALLRLLRINAGMTQVELAERIQVGQSFVSKIERGENFVDVFLFARWCKVCGERPGKTLDRLLKEGPAEE